MKRQADIVRLHIFLGYTEEETAQMLECSSETVTKEYRKAKIARIVGDWGHGYPDSVPDPF